jgi:hypothetical protein
MNKKELNDYYEKILSISQELISSYEEGKIDAINNARFEEEELYFQKAFDNNINSCVKIGNNTVALMVLNGLWLQSDKKSYKDVINYKIPTQNGSYDISKVQLKNILGNDFDSIINGTFFSRSKDTEDKADHNKKQSDVKHKIDIKPIQTKEAPKKETELKLKETKIKSNKAKEKIKAEKNEEKPIVKSVPKANNPSDVKNNKKKEDLKKVKNESNETKLSEPEFSIDLMEEQFEDLLFQDEIDLPQKIVKPKEIKEIAKPVKEIVKFDRSKKDEIIEPEENVMLETGSKKEATNINLPSEKRNKSLALAPTGSENDKNDNTVDEIDEDFDIKITDKGRPVNTLLNGDETRIVKTDLLIDNYMLGYTEKEGSSQKQISILVTPLNLMTSQSFATPIMVIAKSGKEIKAYVSETIVRPSITVTINDEIFVLRGSWNDINFQSLLYPQNSSGYEIRKELKSIRPKEIRNAGHNIQRIDDDIIHIFPLSTRNNEQGYVKSVVCIENKKNKSYQIEIMLHNKYKVDKYEISSAWEGDRFVTRIKS